MKILLTGFKPFNGENINPSTDLLNLIDSNYNGHEIHKLELDVVYEKDALNTINKIKEINPDLVLSIGQAGGRSHVTFEYFGLNMQSASIPDNDGKIHILNEISNSDLAYKTNINVKKLVDNVDNNLFKISFHAGTFVCNDLYFNLLDYIYKNKLNIKCGFIHVPYLKSQTLNKPDYIPHMELESMLTVLKQIINNID